MTTMDMCGAGLHPMNWENQYKLPGGAKHGCWPCIRERAKRRDDKQCRRGHARTEANTYVDPSGKRFCTDCPTKTYAERKKAIAEGETGPRRLTDQEIARLRSLVSCVVCHRVPGDDGWIEHMLGCSVASNIEGIPQKRGPKSKRSQVFAPRQPTACENCGDMVDQVWPNRTLRYCSRICNTQAYRARKAAAEAAAVSS